jgi:hypothetical protein
VPCVRVLVALGMLVLYEKKRVYVRACVCVGAYSGMFRVLVAWGQLFSAIGVYRDLISVKRDLVISVKRDLVSFAACPVALAHTNTHAHINVCVRVCFTSGHEEHLLFH